jgi:hypothetical protein
MILSWFRSLIRESPYWIIKVPDLLLILISILRDLIPQVPWVWLELHWLIIIYFELILLLGLPADYVILLLLLIIFTYFDKIFAHLIPYFSPYTFIKRLMIITFDYFSSDFGCTLCYLIFMYLIFDIVLRLMIIWQLPHLII